MDSKIKQLIELCKTYEEIYIYGAGRNAGTLFSYLGKHNVSASGFIVSDRKENPTTLFSLSVVPVADFRACAHSLILVSIVRECVGYKEIFDCLVSNSIHDVFFITLDLISAMKMEPLPFRIQDIFQDEVYYLGVYAPVEKGHSILSMADADGEEYHWRFRDRMIYEQNIRNISTVFSEKTALEEFEELYGKYRRLKSIKPDLTGVQSIKPDVMDVKSIKPDFVGVKCIKPDVAEVKKTCVIYMAQSHADKTRGSKELLPKWVIPLQVGAALADKRICSLMDNMGENISEKNGIFSECTGLYWMWKNAPKTDYIGLCHYRRHFAVSEEDLINLMNADVDVMVTTPTFVNETVEGFLLTFVPRSDFQILLETIERVCPEYFPTAQRFLKARFYPPCNLSVMKWDLFQEYAEYVFSITFEIEKFYDDLGFMRKDRYMGYLVECLMGIFLMHNKERLKIAYTDMEYYE